MDENVAKAMERMCTPLDESVLKGETAKEDARCMALIRAHLVELEAENAALRACAIKYLGWLDMRDPVAALESDLRDPDMCGAAHLSENSRG